MIYCGGLERVEGKIEFLVIFHRNETLSCLNVAKYLSFVCRNFDRNEVYKTVFKGVRNGKSVIKEN